MKVKIGICKSDREKEDKLQDKVNHGKVNDKLEICDDKAVPIVLERFGNKDANLRFTGREFHK